MNFRKLARTEISEVLDVNPSSIDLWRRKGMPCVKDSKGAYTYDAKEIMEWRVKNEVKKTSAKINKPVSKLQQSKQTHADRKLKAEADLAEIKVREAEGELVEKGLFIEAIENDYTVVRTALRNIPSKMASQLLHKEDPAEVETMLTDEIEGICEELTDFS